MAKVVKQKYTKANGTREVYGYLIPIQKGVMEMSGICIDKDLKIKVENGKIIISN